MPSKTIFHEATRFISQEVINLHNEDKTNFRGINLLMKRPSALLKTCSRCQNKGRPQTCPLTGAFHRFLSLLSYAQTRAVFTYSMSFY